MYSQLVEYLEKCDDAYYNTSNPIVDDSTYDALVETLRRINPKHPYLEKVGAKVRSAQIGRLIPMGTLSKLHTDDEVNKWLDSEDGDLVLLSPKYDGFAVELYYERGTLVTASTRGTGVAGEDVLPSILRIQNIPLTLSKYPNDIVIVRGEAIIPTRHHDKVKELGYTAMRNAVPGIVRACRVEALQYVDFVAYEFIDGNKYRTSQREYYAEDFLIEDYRVYDIRDFAGMKSRRDSLRAETYLYEIDGVVLKTMEIKPDDLLHPDHMVSWKYKSNRETTILREMEYQLGITGYFTPIGIFDEVEFQGAKLSRASLGNITRLRDEFEGMTVGSIVEVSRRGDIIPYIESLSLVNESGDIIEYPTVCPHCGSPLADTDTEPHCVNKECPEKLRLQISQYIRTVGIKGIGDKLIRSLVDAGYIKNITEVYTLDPQKILELPRQGQSAVDKWTLLQEKRLSPVELLTAYPFLDLGRKVWEKVLSKFTYWNVLDLATEDLENAKLAGIGDSKITSIVSQVAENKDELRKLGAIHFDVL